ncbi:MAG: hypothetical protein V9E98_00050 [Candidatus Nanopelagicales bacterium]
MTSKAQWEALTALLPDLSDPATRERIWQAAAQEAERDASKRRARRARAMVRRREERRRKVAVA